MRIIKHLNMISLLLILASAFMFASCSKEEKKDNESSEQPPATGGSTSSAGQSEIGDVSELSYAEGRRIFRIDKKDLNNDGTSELIVLSINEANTDRGSSVHKFDLIEVFTEDKARGKYVKRLSDTVDFAVDASYEDLEGEASKQIIVYTNSGGNSTVASEGMFVFGMRGRDSVNLIKYFDSGAPRLVRSGSGNKQQVVITDLFHGVMPMSDAVPYTAGIYEMVSNELVLSNEKHPEYFDKKLEQLLDKYYGMKKKVEMGMQIADLSYPLYREAAEVIVNYRAKGDTDGLKKFWEKEKDPLRKNIPEDEFTDLSNFVNKILPPEPNA